MTNQRITANISISAQTVAQLRAAKDQVAMKTSQFWSYDTMLRALLLHWQAFPPATLPTTDELLINVEIA